MEILGIENKEKIQYLFGAEDYADSVLLQFRDNENEVLLKVRGSPQGISRVVNNSNVIFGRFVFFQF